MASVENLVVGNIRVETVTLGTTPSASGEPESSQSVTNPPLARLDHLDTAKIRRATHAVTDLYPGAAGKLLAQFLTDYGDFGYRICQTSLPAQLVDDVLAQLPEQR